MNTTILKIKLEEEFNSLINFLYQNNETNNLWYDFCKRKRKGNQSLEALSTLVSSLNKWRDIIDIHKLNQNKKMLYKVKKNPEMEDIEDKAEKALRKLSDVDIELNELIQLCKNYRKLKQ